MNLGELKAFMGDKPGSTDPNAAIKQQLREAGLRQATGLQDSRAGSSVSQFSSQTTVGLRVYNNSLSQNLRINDLQARLPIPDRNEIEQKNKSLFDFEEVAKNVLKFVGGAIKHAQAKGADSDKLLSMFEQARSGVLKGIKMAEKDLAGMMNDEIANGISQSKELIDKGIQRLQEQIFGKPDDKTQDESNESDAQSTQTVVAQSELYQRQDNGDLRIRTQDGDEVTIRFEDFERFETNKLVLINQLQDNTQQQAEAKQKAQTSEEEQSAVQPGSEGELVNDAPKEQAGQEPSTETSVAEAANTPTNNSVVNVESYQHFESSSLSFSVKGELDDDELKAIGALVTDASKLADEFFNGDVEAAFEQALELGFDEKELVGYSLQLTRHEQVQVIQAYESVAHYREDNQNPENVKAAKPIAQYLEKMLDVLEQSQQKLENSSAYNELINSIVNEMKEVQVPDLITAITRFHSFNQKLLENLPVQESRPKEGEPT